MKGSRSSLRFRHGFDEAETKQSALDAYMYYVDDRRSGPDDKMIQREQHVRPDLDTTMTARSIVGELP